MPSRRHTSTWDDEPRYICGDGWTCSCSFDNRSKLSSRIACFTDRGGQSTRNMTMGRYKVHKVCVAQPGTFWAACSRFYLMLAGWYVVQYCGNWSRDSSINAQTQPASQQHKKRGNLCLRRSFRPFVQELFAWQSNIRTCPHLVTVLIRSILSRAVPSFCPTTTTKEDRK